VCVFVRVCVHVCVFMCVYVCVNGNADTLLYMCVITHEVQKKYLTLDKSFLSQMLRQLFELCQHIREIATCESLVKSE